MEIKSKHLNLKLSLFLFIVSSLILSQLIYMVVIFIIDSSMINLMQPKPDSFVYKNGCLITVNYNNHTPSKGVEIVNSDIYNVLLTLRTISPFLIYGISSIISSMLFYNIKLKRSITVLNKGIEKISKKELDFKLQKQSNDELGILCEAFESMRKQLSLNFNYLWKSESNQRSMYHAFAHDLRTPLTIIKGNNEIIELVAAKNNNWIQALQAITASNNAISRIEQYTNQMLQLENIEDLEPLYRTENLQSYFEQYYNQILLVSNKYKKNIKLKFDAYGSGKLDTIILTRILDNLIINALQYANNEVSLYAKLDCDILFISVCDDGIGFTSEALKYATDAFFSTAKPNGHTGIGLTISQKLLKLQNSKLIIANSSNGGANVSFSIKV